MSFVVACVVEKEKAFVRDKSSVLIVDVREAHILCERVFEAHET